MTTQVIADNDEQAQRRSLRAGLLAAAFIALASLAFTRDLPQGSPAAREETAGATATA